MQVLKQNENNILYGEENPTKQEEFRFWILNCGAYMSQTNKLKLRGAIFLTQQIYIVQKLFDDVYKIDYKNVLAKVEKNYY